MMFGRLGWICCLVLDGCQCSPTNLHKNTRFHGYYILWVLLFIPCSKPTKLQFPDELVPRSNWTNTWLQTGLPPGKYYIIKSHAFPQKCCDPFQRIYELDKLRNILFICLDYDVPGMIKSEGSRQPYSGNPENYSSGIQKAKDTFFVPKVLSVEYGSGLTVSLNLQTIFHRADTMLNLQTKYLKIQYQHPKDTARLEQDDYTGEYSGFTCLLCQPPEDAKYPEINLVCPSIAKSLDGGMVKLVVDPLPFISKTLVHDCIWYIKLPSSYKESIFFYSTERWQVYVRVIELTIKGYLEIRAGANSEGKILAIGEKLSSISQPTDGFISDSGLYVRANSLYYMCNISFIYGVFAFKHGTQMTLSSNSVALVCYLHIKGRHYETGFLCEQQKWCIPKTNAMNGVPNCLDGTDESTQVVQSATSNPTPIWTLHPCPFKSGHYKRCSDGRCVRKTGRCSDDPCPDHRPFRCLDGLVCYSSKHICDGYPICHDHTDESTCALNATSNKYLWSCMGAIAVLTASMFYFAFCFGCTFLRQRRVRMTTHTAVYQQTRSAFQLWFQREREWLENQLRRLHEHQRHNLASGYPVEEGGHSSRTPGSGYSGAYPQASIGTGGLTFIPATLPDTMEEMAAPSQHQEAPPSYDDVINTDCSMPPPPYRSVAHIKTTSV